MGRDSNPRDACAPAGFQDRCLQPLGHPSNTELAGILESEARKSNGVDIGANQIVLASRLRQRRRSPVGRQAKRVGGATDQSPSGMSGHIDRRTPDHSNPAGLLPEHFDAQPPHPDTEHDEGALLLHLEAEAGRLGPVLESRNRVTPTPSAKQIVPGVRNRCVTGGNLAVNDHEVEDTVDLGAVRDQTQLGPEVRWEFNSSWCWQKLLCSRATTSLCFCSKRYVIVPIPTPSSRTRLHSKVRSNAVRCASDVRDAI